MNPFETSTDYKDRTFIKMLETHDILEVIKMAESHVCTITFPMIIYNIDVNNGKYMLNYYRVHHPKIFDNFIKYVNPLCMLRYVEFNPDILEWLKEKDRIILKFYLSTDLRKNYDSSTFIEDMLPIAVERRDTEVIRLLIEYVSGRDYSGMAKLCRSIPDDLRPLVVDLSFKELCLERIMRYEYEKGLDVRSRYRHILENFKSEGLKGKEYREYKEREGKDYCPIWMYYFDDEYKGTLDLFYKTK